MDMALVRMDLLGELAFGHPEDTFDPSGRTYGAKRGGTSRRGHEIALRIAYAIGAAHVIAEFEFPPTSANRVLGLTKKILQGLATVKPLDNVGGYRQNLTKRAVALSGAEFVPKHNLCNPKWLVTDVQLLLRAMARADDLTVMRIVSAPNRLFNLPADDSLINELWSPIKRLLRDRIAIYLNDLSSSRQHLLGGTLDILNHGLVLWSRHSMQSWSEQEEDLRAVRGEVQKLAGSGDGCESLRPLLRRLYGLSRIFAVKAAIDEGERHWSGHQVLRNARAQLHLAVGEEEEAWTLCEALERDPQLDRQVAENVLHTKSRLLRLKALRADDYHTWLRQCREVEEILQGHIGHRSAHGDNLHLFYLSLANLQVERALELRWDLQRRLDENHGLPCRLSKREKSKLLCLAERNFERANSLASSKPSREAMCGRCCIAAWGELDSLVETARERAVYNLRELLLVSPHYLVAVTTLFWCLMDLGHVHDAKQLLLESRQDFFDNSMGAAEYLFYYAMFSGASDAEQYRDILERKLNMPLPPVFQFPATSVLDWPVQNRAECAKLLIKCFRLPTAVDGV